MMFSIRSLVFNYNVQDLELERIEKRNHEYSNLTRKRNNKISLNLPLQIIFAYYPQICSLGNFALLVTFFQRSKDDDFFMEFCHGYHL